MDNGRRTELCIIERINVSERNLILVTVEIISGEPVYGMLFSVLGSPGLWKHVGTPHVSFNTGADPEKEKTFIMLQPVGMTEQLSPNMHLVEQMMKNERSPA